MTPAQLKEYFVVIKDCGIENCQLEFDDVKIIVSGLFLEAPTMGRTRTREREPGEGDWAIDSLKDD